MSSLGVKIRGTVRGHTKNCQRSITLSFPPEMFEEIDKIATKENTSFAEQVRILVEWGLESLERHVPITHVKMAQPLLVDADGSFPGIVHPAVQVGNRIFYDSIRYGGGMNSEYIKANNAAKELAVKVEREIIKTIKGLGLT